MEITDEKPIALGKESFLHRDPLCQRASRHLDVDVFQDLGSRSKKVMAALWLLFVLSYLKHIDMI